MDRSNRNPNDRIQYRSARDAEDREQIQHDRRPEGRFHKVSDEVDPNAKTLPIWRNGPPDELYPDDDRRS